MITIKKDDFTFLLNKANHTATIINSHIEEDDVFIPRSIENDSIEYLITSIGERSFYRHFIYSICFPDDSCLETIEEKAFFHSSLNFIQLPSSLVQIKAKAFADCDELTEVEIPINSNLTTIGKNAFFCSSIQSIFIPSKVTKICDGAFNSCTDLEIITIPEDSQLEYIGECAFAWTNIHSIFLPKNLNFLGKNWCKKTSLLIGQYISPLNQNFKFIRCEVPMIVGKSDPNIEDYDSLILVSREARKVTIPSFIKYIKSSAFSGCSVLKTVCFQKDSQLVLIDDDSFTHSTLVNIVIPSSVVRIGKNAFARCECLEKVEFEKNSQLKSIGGNVFLYSSINEIIFPENLCEFDYEWCYNIFKLKMVSVSPENKRLLVLDSKIVLRKSDSKSENFDEIIFACRDIKVAVIPSFVKSIKESAFFGCSELETVEFESNSELVLIGDNAFCNTNISKISIPKSVKFIGKNAFQNCDKLEIIEISEDSELLEIDEFALFMESLNYFYIPSKTEKLHEKWNALSTNLKHISVSPENKNIKYHDDNKKMIVSKSKSESDSFDVLLFVNGIFDSVVIPCSIKHLSAFIFSENKDLENVEFEKNSSLVSIGTAAFRSTKITDLILPEKTKIIEERTFEKCIFLSSIEFLCDEIKIGGHCFCSCFNISIISFPNSKKLDLAYSFVNLDEEYDFVLFTLPFTIIEYFTTNFD